MTNPARIRPARLADAAAIAAIYNHYVLTSTATFREAAEPVAEREQWIAAHTAPHLALVAEDEAGAVLGWASLSRFHERSAFRFTAEDSIYLHPDQCGRGLGGRLLGALLAAADGSGLHTIVAAITSEQERSLALHRSHGFSESGRLRQAGFKFGRWLDLVYLQRPVG